MERFLGNRKDKDEEGSVIILVAVLMVVFLGMAALVVDLGADYVYKAKMQTACDTASRAAASALPDTTKATELAKYYMKENGFTDTRNVQVEFKDSNSKVQVYLKEERKTTFARALGIKSNKISTFAVAGKNGISQPKGFKYAIFYGSESGALNLGGTYDIVGSVHSNGAIDTNPGSGKVDALECNKGTGSSWFGNIKISRINANGVTEYGTISYDGSTNPATRYVTFNSNGKTEKYKLDEFVKENAPVEEMPTYLGDNIDKLIYKPYIPNNCDIVATTADELSRNMGTDKSILFKPTSGSVYLHVPMNISRTLKIDTRSVPVKVSKKESGEVSEEESGEESGELKLQDDQEGSVINGDIIISGNPNVSTELYFRKKTIINGDIYCDGNFKIGGYFEVNGNIYCEKTLTMADEAGPTIKGKFVFGEKVVINNDMKIDGAIVSNGDIDISGGKVSVGSGDDDSLTLYSRRGNINPGQANGDYHGLMFAPKGNIELCANMKVYGSIIANTFSGTQSTMVIRPLDREVDYETNSKNGSAGGTIRLLK